MPIIMSYNNCSCCSSWWWAWGCPKRVELYL